MQSLDFSAQFGSVATCPGTSFRRLKSNQGKHHSERSPPPILKETQALPPGEMALSSKITIPLAAAAAAFPLEDISAQPKLP